MAHRRYTSLQFKITNFIDILVSKMKSFQIILLIVILSLGNFSTVIAQSENTDPPSQVYVYCTTGPLLVTQSYIDDSSNVKLLVPTPIKHNYFGDYGMHLSHGNWKI